MESELRSKKNSIGAVNLPHNKPISITYVKVGSTYQSKQLTNQKTHCQ